MDKSIIYILLGVGAFFLLGKGRKEKFFYIPPGLSPQLPQGGNVAESRLPQYGFVEYPRNSGQWYHQTQLNPLTGGGVTDTNSPEWLQQLNTWVNLGLNLFNYVSESGMIPAITQSAKISNIQALSANLDLKFGTLTYNQTVFRSTNETLVDGKYRIQIFTENDILKVQFAYDFNVVKTYSLNWATGQQQNFSIGYINRNASKENLLYISREGQVNLY
jgi:hypothetical protein